VIVAIDGPAASGKSTVARALARRLGFAYLDTGAMYRAVAALALDRGVALDDETALTQLAETEAITFHHPADDPVPDTVLIGGTDVTAAIRTPEADAAVSAVARVPGVRAAMVAQQRRLARAVDTVVEGRDIGTVVFPHASVKAYLTASAEERARRRHEELTERGHALEERAVHEGIEARDSADSTRAASPLAVADDAVVVDTTGMTVHEVVEHVAGLVGDAS